MPPSVEAMTTTRRARPVDQHAEIKLAGDVAAGLDIDPLHLATLRAGLMGDQGHAQHGLGRRLGLGRTSRQLDAAGLAAPAGMDLGLDRPERPAQALAASSASAGV